METQGQGTRELEGRGPVEAVRLALERAIVDGAGLVSLQVSLRGQDGRWMHHRAFLAQIVWAAVWDALAPDPEDEDAERGPAAGRFVEEVEAELCRAHERFPALHSAHEGYAVIKEELDEVWDLVKAGRSGEQARAELYGELVQVAAMCRRMAEDLAL